MRTLLVIALIVLAAGPAVLDKEEAQAGDPVGYVLYRVASAKQSDGPVKAPTLLEADAKGGIAKVRIVYTPDCSEDIEFSWKFDKDIVFLKPDETFTVTVTPTVSGACPGSRNPFALVIGDGTLITGEIFKTLDEEKKGALSGLEAVTPPQQIHARSAGPGTISGVGSTKFKMKGRIRNAPRLWVSIGLTAASAREAFFWQIVYFYRAVYEMPKPGTEVPITLDAPAKGSQPTVRIPGDLGKDQGKPITPPVVPPVAPPPAGVDPCRDPKVQACIDRWLDQLVALLNRKAPERAPWSISRYGHLVNNQVVSVAPPDGWATTYQSSKHCFVWQVYAKAHEDPLSGGELPPLHQECGGAGGTVPGAVSPGKDQPGKPGTTPPKGATDPKPGSVPGGGTLPVPGGPSATERTLLAEKRLVQPKQTVVVPVRLLNPSGVASTNFVVTYNPSVVVPEGSVVRGSLLGQVQFLANANDAGRIDIGFAGQTGLTADGIVAYLRLKAVGKPGDRTPLTLSVTDLRDPKDAKLPIKLVHGEVVIASADDRVPGDCDGDGLLTAADALCALQMSVRLRPVHMMMDVNADGQVTAADAGIILRRIP